MSEIQNINPGNTSVQSFQCKEWGSRQKKKGETMKKNKKKCTHCQIVKVRDSREIKVQNKWFTFLASKSLDLCWVPDSAGCICGVVFHSLCVSTWVCIYTVGKRVYFLKVCSQWVTVCEFVYGRGWFAKHTAAFCVIHADEQMIMGVVVSVEEHRSMALIYF